MTAFGNCYGQIAKLRSLFTSQVPFIALTATATSTTIKAISQNLELNDASYIVSIPDRSNIRYSVVKIKEESLDKMFDWLVKKLATRKFLCERTLVFCQSHRNVCDLYAIFNDHLKGDFDGDKLPFNMFHGASEEEIKSEITKSFADPKGELRVLFATIAFGMGVDCKDLHEVIHLGPPKGLDDLCQESGRAGRDGKQSHAVVLVYPRSAPKKMTKEMREYITNDTICRREFLMKGFPGIFKKVTPLHLCCDLCTQKCVCDVANQKCECSDSPSQFTSAAETHFKCLSKKCCDEESQSTEVQSIAVGGNEKLKGKLLQLRKSRSSSDVQLYTGLDLTSGLPVFTINKILPTVDNITSEEQLREKYCILDATLCCEIMSMIKDMRSQYGIN